MSFLQKAKGRAAEVARDAADASARAAGAATSKAQDPETQARVRSGLASAGRTAGDAAGASAKAAGAVAAKAQDPATQAKVKDGIAAAGRGARTMVERIDPGILADMIIKATALQEKANARLRGKGSIYRIGEIAVTASLPPGITFSIVRADEADHAASGGEIHTSTEILAEEEADKATAAGADPVIEIVSLDSEEQAAIAFEMAEAEASMEATVDALTATQGDKPPEAGDEGA